METHFDKIVDRLIGFDKWMNQQRLAWYKKYRPSYPDHFISEQESEIYEETH